MEAKTVRRRGRQISPEESREILERVDYGVLATVDSDGQPYAVPLSYLFLDGRLYFHCAHMGHKIDNLTANPRVSFAVTGRAESVYNGGFSVYYESVVVFGRAVPIVDDGERSAILYALTKKYFPDKLDGLEEYIKGHLRPTAVWAIDPEVITGKAHREKG